MSKTPATNPAVARKSITLPTSLWQAVDNYRFSERIGSQAEAVRRLLQEALVNWGDDGSTAGKEVET